ncbi:MAG: PEP-CTERM system TPR-repeat protein PrsT [Nitrospiraceae bacterium]|nr:PEP-CTERM system TPR-repeat protein PrsT [Nitrospiraceae bacterium]
MGGNADGFRTMPGMRAAAARMAKSISVFLAVVLILGSCQPKTKQQLLGEAAASLKKGDARSAVIYLKKALDKDGNYTDARLELATAYRRLGKLESARNELLKILKANPSLEKAHIGLARVYLEQSKPDDALAELGKIPAAKAAGAQVLDETGWAYALKNEYPAALDSFQKALSAPGADAAEIGLHIAKVYFGMGDMAKTQQELSWVLKKDPADRDAIHLLAAVQTRENDIDGAIRTYAMAGKTDIQARYNTGLLLMGKNQFGQALDISGQIISSWPHRPEGYMLKGVALFSMKRYGDASGFLRKTLTMTQTPGAHYYLGLCLYNMNDLEEALDELNKSISLDPSLVPAQNLAGLILMKQKRTDEAIAQLKRFISTGKDNAATHNLLANAYFARGMKSEGMDELNKAISMDPSFADARIQKGVILLGSGRLPEAETELKAAVSLNPGALNARLLLASFYERRKEYAKAMDVLGKGLKGQKADAPVYDAMARILAVQNRIPEAEADLLKAEAIDPGYPGAYFDLSALYARTGQTGKAALEMETLCQRAPGNLNALLGAASLLEAAGQDAAAQKYYGLAEQTGKPEGYMALAAYWMRKKRTADALAALDGGLSKNPSTASLYEMKGGILVGSGNLDGAVKTYEALEKVDPGAGRALLLKAYIGSRKTGPALDLIKSELARNPGDIQAMTQLSGIYMTMGRPAQALDAARQIISRQPASPVGYMQLALIQSATSPDAAIETLKGPRVPKNPAVSLMLGDMYFRKKAYAMALREFMTAERMKPDFAEAFYQQGVALQAMGENGPAAAAYRKVLGMEPRNILALNNLAYIYASQNRDITAALKLASAAYALAPQNGNIMDTYGFLLLESGRAAPALDMLKKASALQPGSPTILYHLALAQNARGEKAMAISTLRKCAGMGNFPEAGQARALLARLAGANARTKGGPWTHKAGRT